MPTPESQRGHAGLIAGVVLAAGLSRRLGRPKQLLELGGAPLVAHVVERANASALDRVIVVTGHAHEDVATALRGQVANVVFNPHFAEGQSTSLIAGVKALPTDCDALVVLLGDQPLVSASAIDRLIARRRAHGDAVVMTGYGETRSHPILFGRELFPELLTASGDQGARQIVRRHRDAVAVVESGEASPPADVDTEEAYAALLDAWAGRR